MIKVIGLHYYNIFEYISDIRHFLNDMSSDAINFEGKYIDTLLGNPACKLIMLNNDYIYAKSFIDENGSQYERQRFMDFISISNVYVLEDSVQDKKLFGILNYCNENGYECMVTPKIVHGYKIRLLSHCKKYIQRYNIPGNEYNKIIINSSVCLFFILKNKSKMPSNLLLVAEYLLGNTIKGKEVLMVRKAVDNVIDYVYLHGDNSDITYMNDFLNKITIIDDLPGYVSNHIRDRVGNCETVLKYHDKFIQTESKFEDIRKKLGEISYEIYISSNLNIPLFVSDLKSISMFPRTSCMMIYNKIKLGFD